MARSLTLWDEDTEAWLYDDPDLDVFEEPFLLGTGAMLSYLRHLHIGGNERTPFRILFSDEDFPGAIPATKIHPREKGSGTRST